MTGLFLSVSPTELFVGFCLDPSLVLVGSVDHSPDCLLMACFWVTVLLRGSIDVPVGIFATHQSVTRLLVFDSDIHLPSAVPVTVVR